MGDNDSSQPVMIRIDWLELHDAAMYFLHKSNDLPLTLTDEQLVDLMTACGNARARLLKEKSGG